jgi:hypothetical protein
MCRLAEAARAPVMIFHVSTAEAVAEIAAARARGAPVWAETCPHYLFQTEAVLDRPGLEGAKWMCSPPSARWQTRRRSGPHSPGATCRWCPPTTPPTASTRPASCPPARRALPRHRQRHAGAGGAPAPDVRRDGEPWTPRPVEIRRPHRHDPRPPLRPDREGPYRPRFRRRPHVSGTRSRPSPTAPTTSTTTSATTRGRAPPSPAGRSTSS